MDKFTPDRWAELATDIETIMSTLMNNEDYSPLTTDGENDLIEDKCIEYFGRKWKEICKE